jgi:hypothetical protein
MINLKTCTRPKRKKQNRKKQKKKTTTHVAFTKKLNRNKRVLIFSLHNAVDIFPSSLLRAAAAAAAASAAAALLLLLLSLLFGR